LQSLLWIAAASANRFVEVALQIPLIEAAGHPSLQIAICKGGKVEAAGITASIEAFLPLL